MADTDILDELDEDVDELEEEDDDDLVDELEETPEDAPKAKRKPPTRPAIEFNSAWLAEYLNTQSGSSYDARGLRVLLRKLAADGVITRVVGEDRSRYDFTGGPDSPTVKAILAAVKTAAAAKAAPKEKKAKVVKEETVEEVVAEEAPAPAPVKKTRRKPAAPAA